MTVSRIKGVIACDGCGARFTVDIDAAYKPPQDWAMFDVAVDAVRGGADGSSVQGGMMLCQKCTCMADDYGRDDRPLTADEVRAALAR